MQYSFQSEAVLLAAEGAAQSLGYDEIDMVGAHISIGRGEATVTVYCHDAFQPHWGQGNIQSGSVNFPMDQNGRVTTKGLLSREQRELTYLAKQAGKTLELSKALTSAAGRKFAEDLLASTRQLQNLLPYVQQNELAEKLRRLDVPGETIDADDEVPY